MRCLGGWLLGACCYGVWCVVWFCGCGVLWLVVVCGWGVWGVGGGLVFCCVWVLVCVFVGCVCVGFGCCCGWLGSPVLFWVCFFIDVVKVGFVLFWWSVFTVVTLVWGVWRVCGWRCVVAQCLDVSEVGFVPFCFVGGYLFVGGGLI